MTRITDEDVKAEYKFHFQYVALLPQWAAFRRNSYRSVYAPGESFFALTLWGVKRKCRRWMEQKPVLAAISAAANATNEETK